MEKRNSQNLKFPSNPVITAYTIVALLYCAASIWIYFNIVGDRLVGCIHVAAFFGVIAHYILVTSRERIVLGTHIILLVGTLVVLSQFVTGGWDHSGLLWTFAYLPYAFFLGNKQTTSFWVSTLVILYVISFVTHHLTDFDLPYSSIQLGVFFGALTVFLICLGAYQYANMTYLQQVQDYEDNSEKINSILQKEIDEHKIAEEKLKNKSLDLEAKTQQLEALNNLMVGRELKMIELKEKIAELEKK